MIEVVTQWISRVEIIVGVEISKIVVTTEVITTIEVAIVAIKTIAGIEVIVVGSVIISAKIWIGNIVQARREGVKAMTSKDNYWKN